MEMDIWDPSTLTVEEGIKADAFIKEMQLEKNAASKQIIRAKRKLFNVALCAILMTQYLPPNQEITNSKAPNSNVSDIIGVLFESINKKIFQPLNAEDQLTE
jgi:hypothetical protein